MTVPDESNESKLKKLREQVTIWNDKAEKARKEGNSELVRQALERKRHIQNRLAFLAKLKEFGGEI
jgi:phage shock protein A